jgi:hypothetical protein
VLNDPTAPFVRCKVGSMLQLGYRRQSRHSFSLMDFRDVKASHLRGCKSCMNHHKINELARAYHSTQHPLANDSSFAPSRAELGGHRYRAGRPVASHALPSPRDFQFLEFCAILTK